MIKILQCSDGTVRRIDALRELDEVVGYLVARRRYRHPRLNLSIDSFQGCTEFALADNGAAWCRVYPENHPEAPQVNA